MTTPFTHDIASWIWSGEGDFEIPRAGSPSHYQVRRFRKEFDCTAGQDQTLTLHVSADTRFVLYCNGHLLGRGPCPGDVLHHYYESITVPPELLRERGNCLTAVVFDYSPVHCNPAHLGAPAAFMTHSGGFLLEMHGGPDVLLGTDETWKVQVDEAYHFHAEGNIFGAFIGYFEDLHLAKVPGGWQEAGFNDSGWSNARVLYPGTLRSRYIDAGGPYGLVPHEAARPVETRLGLDGRQQPFAPGGEAAGPEWSAFLLENKPCTLPPRHEETVILPLAKEWTAFPRLKFSGGAGATLRLRYAEALRLPKTTPGATIFGANQSTADVAIGWSDDSTGWTFDPRGTLGGYFDQIRLDGTPGTYEPHHFRTFKYLALEVTTGEEPLRLESLEILSTGYPLEDRAAFTSSDAMLNQIYAISWHTLRLSAHETYFDCPYYEQLQYVTDGYINMLNTMVGAGEFRLPRQFVEQAAWSLNSEGMLGSRYPSRLPGFIPGQCLDWVFSLRDYTLHSGDLDFARAHLRQLDAVLGFFEDRLGSTGLPENLPWWNWIDWCPGWKRGVPPGADAGPVLSMSAKYAMALRQAAELATWCGQEARADAFLEGWEKARGAIQNTFWNEATGRYAENVLDPCYSSQLGNAYAVLAGVPDAEQKAALRQAFVDGTMTPASFMGVFFIRLARAELGIYSLDHLGAPYREMIDYGLSTWAEDPVYWRSLCHGYSAHPIVDCLTILLGIRVLQPGGAQVRIEPLLDALPAASGQLITPRGGVRVGWKTSGSVRCLSIDLPDGIAGTLVAAGESHLLQAGHNALEMDVCSPTAREKIGVVRVETTHYATSRDKHPAYSQPVA